MLTGKGLTKITDEVGTILSTTPMEILHSGPSKATSRYTDKWQGTLEVGLSDGSIVKIQTSGYRYPSVEQKAKILWEKKVTARIESIVATTLKFAPSVEIDMVLARKTAIEEIGNFSV